jgi:hypothetical protein
MSVLALLQCRLEDQIDAFVGENVTGLVVDQLSVTV